MKKEPVKFLISGNFGDWQQSVASLSELQELQLVYLL